MLSTQDGSWQNGLIAFLSCLSRPANHPSPSASLRSTNSLVQTGPSRPSDPELRQCPTKASLKMPVLLQNTGIADNVTPYCSKYQTVRCGSDLRYIMKQRQHTVDSRVPQHYVSVTPVVITSLKKAWIVLERLTLLESVILSAGSSLKHLCHSQLTVRFGPKNRNQVRKVLQEK